MFSLIPQLKSQFKTLNCIYCKFHCLVRKVWSLAEVQFPKYIERLPDHGPLGFRKPNTFFQIHIICEMVKEESSKRFHSNPPKECHFCMLVPRKGAYVPDLHPHYEGYHVTLNISTFHYTSKHESKTSMWLLLLICKLLATIQQYLLKFSKMNHTF